MRRINLVRHYYQLFLYIMFQDYEDVEAFICKAYEGELPKTCEELALVIAPEAKANRLHHVSRINKIIAPLQLAQKQDF